MGVVFMLVVFATPCAALLLTYLVLFEDGAKSSGRWGFRRQKVALGASPYRAGESTEELPQGAPVWLRFVCWFCAMGGVVTTGLLAPAGLILIFVTLEQGAGFASLPVFFVSGSGFPAGVMLIRAARKVARHEAVSASTFHYLYAHHASVAGTMLLLDAVSRRGLQVSPFSVIVCLVMVGVIMVLHSAAETLPKGGDSPPQGGFTRGGR